MSRAPRLLALLQALQSRRAPVTAEVLAADLGVSTRTLYRDIAALKGEGAPIAGAAGLGYVLERGFFLPPLAFDAEEVDALLLGLRFAAGRRDPGLAAAAARALAKIVAVLPDEAARDVAAGPLLAGPGPPSPHLPMLRRAMREERRLALAYRDGAGRESRRVVWPVAVGGRLLRGRRGPGRLMRGAERLPPFPARPHPGRHDAPGPHAPPTSPAPGRMARRRAPGSVMRPPDTICHGLSPG